MTKHTGKKKKRKYNYLMKSGTYKLRADYIETGYVNGVKDSDGRLVMRPLNQEEKEFLDKFYKEAVHGNFSTTPEIKELKEQIKQAKKDYKDHYEKEGFYPPFVKNLEKKLVKLRKELDLFYTNDGDIKEIEHETNSRNRCIFNKAKVSGNLIGIDMTQYDVTALDPLKKDEED